MCQACEQRRGVWASQAGGGGYPTVAASTTPGLARSPAACVGIKICFSSSVLSWVWVSLRTSIRNLEKNICIARQISQTYSAIRHLSKHLSGTSHNHIRSFTFQFSHSNDPRHAPKLTFSSQRQIWNKTSALHDKFLKLQTSDIISLSQVSKFPYWTPPRTSHNPIRSFTSRDPHLN